VRRYTELRYTECPGTIVLFLVDTGIENKMEKKRSWVDRKVR